MPPGLRIADMVSASATHEPLLYVRSLPTMTSASYSVASNGPHCNADAVIVPVLPSMELLLRSMLRLASANTSGLLSVAITDAAPSFESAMLANAVPHPSSTMDLRSNIDGLIRCNSSRSRVRSMPLFHTATFMWDEVKTGGEDICE